MQAKKGRRAPVILVTNAQQTRLRYPDVQKIT